MRESKKYNILTEFIKIVGIIYFVLILINLFLKDTYVPFSIIMFLMCFISLSFLIPGLWYLKYDKNKKHGISYLLGIGGIVFWGFAPYTDGIVSLGFDPIDSYGFISYIINKHIIKLIFLLLSASLFWLSFYLGKNSWAERIVKGDIEKKME